MGFGLSIHGFGLLWFRSAWEQVGVEGSRDDFS